MTPKQKAYVQHRARGLGRERAAIEAGYAPRSASSTASDLEKDPRIAGAIREARQAAGATRTRREYADPASYLAAVVAGREEADAIRCAAAKALLPYTSPLRRAPKGRAVKPHDQAHIQELRAEQGRLDEWNRKADKIRARFEKKNQ
jgi:Terminase small subunit